MIQTSASTLSVDASTRHKWLVLPPSYPLHLIVRIMFPHHSFTGAPSRRIGGTGTVMADARSYFRESGTMQKRCANAA